MKKHTKVRLASQLIIISFLLTGCGTKDAQNRCRAFAEGLSEAQSLSFTANVRAEYERKTARFALRYEQDTEGAAVTVLAPELIAGVTARVRGSGTEIEFDSVILDTGSLDSFGLSPMSALPVLVQTMRIGHMESFREEGTLTVIELEGENGRRCTVWFDEGMTPVKAELVSGGRVTVYAEISEWSMT